MSKTSAHPLNQLEKHLQKIGQIIEDLQDSHLEVETLQQQLEHLSTETLDKQALIELNTALKSRNNKVGVQQISPLINLFQQTLQCFQQAAPSLQQAIKVRDRLVFPKVIVQYYPYGNIYSEPAPQIMTWPQGSFFGHDGLTDLIVTNEEEGSGQLIYDQLLCGRTGIILHLFEGSCQVYHLGESCEPHVLNQAWQEDKILLQEGSTILIGGDQIRIMEISWPKSTEGLTKKAEQQTEAIKPGLFRSLNISSNNLIYINLHYQPFIYIQA